jgi:hypothetical protein
MSFKHESSGPRGRCLAMAMTLTTLALLLVGMATLSAAQTTIQTGSIQGIITDPSGAVVVGAKVSITGKATGQVVNVTTNSAGAYTSGALIPATTRSGSRPRDSRPCKWRWLSR